MSGDPPPAKLRATTSTKNRPRSPSPYRTTSGTTVPEFVNEFWQHTISTAEQSEEDFKHQALPLARIKKVMKSDPEVRMISSEVTVLFEKACQIFIQELTARSHLISLESRRRTLSRPDVATAVSKSDMFDFLIDIIPRDEAASGGASGTATPAEGVRRGRKGKGSAKKRSRKTSADGDDDDGTYGEEDGTPMGSEMGTEADYASATGEQDAPVQQSGKKARIENLVDGGFHQQPLQGLVWDPNAFSLPETGEGFFAPPQE